MREELEKEQHKYTQNQMQMQNEPLDNKEYMHHDDESQSSVSASVSKSLPSQSMNKSNQTKRTHDLK